MKNNAISEGKRLLDDKKYVQALNYFEQLVAKEGSNDEILYSIGICHVHLKHYDDAAVFFNKILDAATAYPLLLFQSAMILGIIYTINQRLRLAEETFGRIFEMGFQSSRAYAALGHVLYIQGKTKQSIAALEEALKIDSEYPGALNSLGYILVEEHINHTRGLDYCKRACGKISDNPVYLDSLGRAYFHNGDLENALSCLKRAQQLAPRNREIIHHLNNARQSIRK